VVILCVEIGWGIFWFRHLLEERDRIVQQLRRQHSSDVEAVTHFIAETIALQILLRTELTDGKGGPGDYYTRIDALYRQLSNIAREADYQYKLAANRIRLGLSEIHPGTSASPTGRWLNLKIREEFLDEKSLADGYKRLTERMSKD